MGEPATGRPDARHERRLLLVAAATLYALYFAYLTMGLGLDMVVSDVLRYWEKSLEPSVALYDTWWPPGYPLLLALARGLTWNLLPPLAVLSLVAGISYLIAVWTVHAMADERGWPHPSRIALLFAVYPFVGLGASVYPYADSAAIAFLLLALRCFERREWGWFSAHAAMALMVHKATWFLIPPLSLVAFVRHRNARPLLPLAYLPLVLWIVCGAVHYGDPLWFMRWGVDHLIVSRSRLPIGDGLVGPLLSGDWAKMFKGLIVLAVAGLAVVCGVASLRAGIWSGACISFSLVVMALAINQYEIWVVPRFSKVLVVPLGYLLARSRFEAMVLSGRGYAASLVLCLASNLLYGYHLAKFFAK